MSDSHLVVDPEEPNFYAEGLLSKIQPQVELLEEMKRNLAISRPFPHIRNVEEFAERMAQDRARQIDDFFFQYVSGWQARAIFRFPRLKKIFGWELRVHLKDQNRIDLYRHGKIVACLLITNPVSIVPSKGVTMIGGSYENFSPSRKDTHKSTEERVQK